MEQALEIRLPAVYRELVVPFPIPAYAGNSDSELWDDPDSLIQLNHELRGGTGGIQPWPAHMFALGRDGSGCTRAIDLRDPAGPVWWADRCHLDAVGSGPEFPSLIAWAEGHLAEWAVELEEKGLSEGASPEERDRADAEGARAGCVLILGVAGAAALIVFAAWLVVKFLAS
jgi:hypothetical protein